MPLNPKLEELLEKDFDSLYSCDVGKLREWHGKSWDDFKGNAEAVGSTENRIIKTSIRDTPIRIYHPEDKGLHPVFIWIHGGGFVLGNVKVYDAICRTITNNVHCTVISLDYGLAPEHKFPKPVEECYQVIKWIYENAKELKIVPEKIAIGGDSAGGTLSAVISRLSKEKGEFPIVHQTLINAMYDMLGQTKPASRIENAKGYRLTTEAIEGFFANLYLNNRGEAANPLASPLLAENFEGLPPALIITSEYDPLRDEGEHYAKRLSQAGVKVCLKRYDGIIHGFFNMQKTLPEARDALALVCTELTTVFKK